jgi:hypothetical protein
MGIPTGVEPCAEEKIQSLGSIAYHDELVPDVILAECPDGQGLIIRVIFHQEDHPRVHSASLLYRVK